MSDLYEVLKQCGERIQRYRQSRQRVGESNTKAGLIEPVIAALGWDVLDPDEVHREYRRRPSDNPVDYALLLLRTPRLFIEAKGLGENLDDPRWANQTISYAAVAGVEWVALTDGAEWRVFNAHAPVPIEQKLFRAVHIDDVQDALELLALLSKDNMRENRIEELWTGFFIDRQVHAELAAMFDSEPAVELVSVLSRRLSKLSKDEIRASLVRVRAAFDFPTSAPPLPSDASSSAAESRSIPPTGRDDLVGLRPPPPARPTAQRQTVVGRVTPQERRLSVLAVMATGRLQAGPLEADYLRERHRADLMADGTVRYCGETFPSLSAAGAAVKKAVRGPDVAETVHATDGWEFWRGRDEKVGDIVSLKEIRRRIAGEAPGR